MTTLNDVCVAIVDCEHKTAPKAPKGYPSVRTTDIKNGRIDFEGANRVSEDTYQSWTKRRRPVPGDLILAREAPVGEVGLIPEGVFPVLGQRTVLLSPDRDRVVPRYLHYLLLSPVLQHEIEIRSAGSTVHHLNMKDIRELRLPQLPDLTIQSAIAATLGALDDKIEVNRRMAATLEEMARALYRSWFVDFDPVTARAQGRAPAHMGETTAALFPARLTDAGLPEGWEMGTLADIAHLTPEKWSKKNAPVAVEYVDLANTKWGVIETTTPYMWEDCPSRARLILRPGDTIVGTVRPGNGSFAIVGRDGLTGSTGFAVLRPKVNEARELVYLAATEPANIERLANLADGGAYPAVRPEVVMSSPIALCDGSLLRAFHAEVAPLIDRIETSKVENRTLAALRDALLPKLMSGELRVREAEAQVAEAV